MNGEQQDIRDQGGTIAGRLRRAELDVAVSVEIRAESRRVLYALTIPEYMEAWLQMPDLEKLECSADSRAPNSFHIDLYSSEASHTRIEGFCLLSSPDWIVYLWKNSCAGNNAETMVGIHLRSGPGQCTVDLKHSGFCNLEESVWHSRMWHSSLDKLCKLMTKMNGSAH
jgi:uncharacterized protein YndB with AHSA1/START domain